MHLLKACGLYLKEMSSVEEPQYFQEEKDYRNHMSSLVHKRAKATYQHYIWDSFQHELKSNWPRNSWAFEIKGKLAFSFSYNFVFPYENGHLTVVDVAMPLLQGLN